MKVIHYQMVDTWRKIGYPDSLSHDEKFTVLSRQILCLQEELDELKKGIEKSDRNEIIDGYCDIMWVLMMAASIIHYSPIMNVRKLIEEDNYSLAGQVRRLQGHIDVLYNTYKYAMSDDTSKIDEFKQNIAQGIYRCLSGLRYEVSFTNRTDLDIMVENCFSEVIFSNYSKIVDGKLPLDSTGKITKSVAKANGTYVEPDFTRFLVR